MKTAVIFILFTLLLILDNGSLGSTSGATEETPCRFYPPTKSWAFEIDLGDLSKCDPDYRAATDYSLLLLRRINAAEIAKSEGRRIIVLNGFQKSGQSNHLGTLNIAVESNMQGNAEALRTTTIEQAIISKRIRRNQIKTLQYKQIPIVRYSIPGDNPNEVAFPTFNGASTVGLEAYIVEDNTWITIGFSAKPFKDADEKSFYSLLDSFRVIDISNPNTSFDYSQLGHALYQQREYRKATVALDNALAMEKQHRELTVNNWRTLVEDATDIFGVIGQTKRSKEILEYGVSVDPTYPYFHLGLARLYASIGELDLSLSQLAETFHYAKQNPKVLVGPLPDPMFDPAFAAFKNDPKFREAVKSIKKLR
jgi:tetratricopeptide (TPR) repeat protein